MSKRKHQIVFESGEKTPKILTENKHSLDSDEEDYAVEEERRNVLHTDDIEGEEEGDGGIEGEITITPFNMKEELEEGHFDTEGHYHWKKETEIKDSWLDNIDWVRVKGRPEDKYKIHKDGESKGLGDESSSESEDENSKNFNLIEDYAKILKYMKPKETIAKSLQRLGGNNARLSSAERWKRKKAGIADEGAEHVTKLTELANEILTRTGNMDIYQETFEKISLILERHNKKTGSSSKCNEEELDMYADDFDSKEKEKITVVHGSNNASSNGNNVEEDEETEEKLMWEFKWVQQSDAEVHGPHTTEQMLKWVNDGYFKQGVWVRKCGQNGDFYTSNRIDFDLYL